MLENVLKIVMAIEQKCKTIETDEEQDEIEDEQCKG